MAAQLQQLFNRPPPASASSASASRPSASSSSSSSSSSIAPSAPSFSSACHCLVVDPQRFVAASGDAARLAAAIKASDRDRRLHVLALLSCVDHHDIAAAYVIVGSTPQLHINFHSFAALGAALISHPFLVRCGLQQEKPAWGATPCGPAKDALPELLVLTCEAPREVSPDECSREVTALLASMNIESTSVNTSMPSVYYRGNHPARMTITVVPRSILDMREDIVRLYRTHTLFGCEVQVSAPNREDLARCGQCDEIGHRTAACPTFSGVAVRLLFRDPMPYAGMLSLVVAAGARTGYLGSAMGEGRPRRVVTLLFNDDDRSGTAMNGMMARVGSLVEELRDRLHCQPALVDTADRDRECQECGVSKREHQCVFESSASSLRRTIVQQHAHQQPQQQQQHQQQQQQQQHASSSPPARAAQQASAPRPRLTGQAGAALRATQVCSEWHSSKQCRLLNGGAGAGGQRCGYAHPADYITSSTPICHTFRDSGVCERAGSCKYLHGSVAQSAIAAGAAAAASDVRPRPVVFAPAAAAASAHASVRLSASAPSPASASVVGSSRIRDSAAVPPPIAAPISILPRPSLDDMQRDRLEQMAVSSSALSAPPSSTVHTRAKAPTRIVVQPASGGNRQKRSRVTTPPSTAASPIAPITPPARVAKGKGQGKSSKKATQDDDASALAPLVLSNSFAGLDELNDNDAVPASSSSSLASTSAASSSSSSSSSAVPVSSLSSISSPHRLTLASTRRSMSAASNSAQRSISNSRSSSSGSSSSSSAAVAAAVPTATPPPPRLARASAPPPAPGIIDNDGPDDAAPSPSSSSSSPRSSAHDAEMQ